jgi:hypothetical protein
MVNALLRRCIRLYVRSAAGLAARLFAPRGGFLPPGEPVLDGFATIRATAGVVVLLLVNATYGTDLGGLHGIPFSPPSLGDSWVVGGAPGVIVVLALAAVCFTRRGFRRRATRQLLCPVQTVIICLALLFGCGWGLRLLDQVTVYGLASLGLSLLSALVNVWFIIFGVCALWCCAIGPFRTGDGHPLLAPATTTAFAWLATIHAILTGGPPAGMPQTMYFTLIFGGPATVMGMSGIEAWLLRSKYPAEFPFREGPLATHPGPSPPWRGVRPAAFLGQQIAGFGQQLKELSQRLTRPTPG